MVSCELRSLLFQTNCQQGPGLSGATEYLNVANSEILIGYIISIDNLKTTG